ncbi:hypothetical protein ACHAXH_007528 [Discostella pseudostelligera]
MTSIHIPCRRLRRTCVQLNNGFDDKDESNSFNSEYEDLFDLSILSDRISQMKQTEKSFVSDLQKRMKSIARAEEFDSSISYEKSNNNTSRDPIIVDLPVACFDALLPNQSLTGSTTDPTFCHFLQSIGLGGTIVITSLNSRQRKLRRFGVIARIELVDVDDTNDEMEESRLFSIPTSVTFSIAGKRRCEILGPSKDMKQRVGRWRRVYDPNGEEDRLGWGEERFLDNSDDTISLDVHCKSASAVMSDDTLWSTNKVLIIDEDSEDSEPSSNAVASAAYLIPLIERWISLASEQTTYDNVDVVARTRRKAGQPGLSVNASALIRKVQLELGPMPPPERPTAFAVWGAALINPLPPLGVAAEIRGAVLDAVDAERKLAVLERGLVKSINNLDGTKPLNM